MVQTKYRSGSEDGFDITINKNDKIYVTINSSVLTNGIYTVRVINGEKQMVKKLVIEK